MIDSTFYGVCAYRRLQAGQYRRQNLHRSSDHPRFYHRQTTLHRRTTRQLYRRPVRLVRQPHYRPRSIFYIYRRRPRVN